MSGKAVTGDLAADAVDARVTEIEVVRTALEQRHAARQLVHGNGSPVLAFRRETAGPLLARQLAGALERVA